MKGNTKLIMVTGLTMISLLVMSILTLNLPVKVQQAQNQTSPILSQVQKKSVELTEKFRQLVTKSGREYHSATEWQSRRSIAQSHAVRRL